ncbi:MAG: hypothetical protein WDO69_20205 [Pseudomonadota bacterium]
MRRFAVVLISTLFPFSLLSLTTQSALADEPDAETPPPAAPAGPPPGAVLVPVEEEQPFKQIAIMANPLGFFIGRYSLDVEYLPALHHAITLTPFYTHAPVKVTINGTEVDGGSLNGGGGELGYKFYTGKKGPNGFFVGPSFLFGSYTQSFEGQKGDSFTSIGGAIDFGGQAVIGPGFVIGGGFGMQWTKTSKDINTDNLNLASAIIAGGGLRPRFLFTVGYAF